MLQEPQNVTLIENSVFADRISYASQDEIILNLGCPQKKRQDKERQREHHVKTEAENRVMLLQAREYQEPPEAVRGKEALPTRDTGGSVAVSKHRVQSLGPQNCYRINFCVLKSPNLWYCVVAVQETNSIKFINW